jgi:hypothetical protein
MIKSESIAELSKSLSALQGVVHDGIKDSKGGHGKYADLAQLLQIIRPELSKHKLSFSQHPSVEGDHIALTSLLTHESGEWIESTLMLKIPPARGANESQAVGSGITYARRYSLAAIFGISQEDDDGNYKKAKATVAAPMAEPAAPLVQADSRVVIQICALVAEGEIDDAKELLQMTGDAKRETWRALDESTREELKKEYS